MKIVFSPARMDQTLTASVAGDTITLNEQTVDMSGVDEGMAVDAETFGCDWITGSVARQDGVLHLILILPHGADAPQETLFPEPVAAGGGPVVLPPHGRTASTLSDDIPEDAAAGGAPLSEQPPF